MLLDNRAFLWLRYGYNEEEKAYMLSLDERLRALRGDLPAEDPAVSGPEAALGQASAGGASVQEERGPKSAEPNYLVVQVWLYPTCLRSQG